MAQVPRPLYEFGEFRLDAAERLLLRDGETLSLTPKIFDTLLLLVEDHGRLIKKDEFMQRLWPGTYVSEDTLAHNISVIRKVLADGSNGQTLIATVSKVGYRFVATVREFPALERDPAQKKPVDVSPAASEMVSVTTVRPSTAGIELGAAAAPALEPSRLVRKSVLHFPFGT